MGRRERYSIGCVNAFGIRCDSPESDSGAPATHPEASLRDAAQAVERTPNGNDYGEDRRGSIICCIGIDEAIIERGPEGEAMYDL